LLPFLFGSGLEKIVEEASNSPFDIVTDLTNHFDIHTGRIPQVPVTSTTAGFSISPGAEPAEWTTT
jgi:hypothetical protein